jgi:3-hydroxybutyryl-CoA dehydrogenase
MGKETPIITDRLTDLAGCDVIIETVIEDLTVKQEIFQRLDGIAKNTCIFATNSSSLDVTDVFYDGKAKERCLGLHFFYPLKVISTVEVNAGPDTSEETVKEMVKFLSMTGRKPLVLRGETRLVLSKLLITLAAYTYKLSLEGELSLKELDQITKQVLLFGIFEMVDSTGFPIISQCLTNLPDKLHSTLFQPLLLQISDFMKQGKDGRRGEGLLSLDDSVKKDTTFIENREECYEVYGIRFLSFLLNEIARYMEDPLLDKKQFQESIQEVLGLSASLKAFYKELQEEKLLETLMAEYKKTLDPLFLPVDFCVYREL